MRLDPASAAQYALIAICLVLIGAILTPGSVGINERGAVLAGIVAVLVALSWRGRRGPGSRGGADGDSEDIGQPYIP